MFCSQVKEFLSRAGVSYEDKNVADDPRALDELRQLGMMTTPVTVLGEQVIVGFDKSKLEALVAALAAETEK